jgi:hypothetical protein
MLKYINKILVGIGISLISVISYGQFGDDTLSMSNAKINNTFTFRNSLITGITVGDSFPTTDWVDLRIKGSALTEQVLYNIGGSIKGFGQIYSPLSIFSPIYDLVGMTAPSFYIHSYATTSLPTYSFVNAQNIGFQGISSTSFGAYYNATNIFIVDKDSLYMNKPIKGNHGLMTTTSTTSLINNSILNIPSSLEKITVMDTVVVIDKDSLKYYIFDLDILADTNYVLLHQSTGGGGTGDVSVYGTPIVGQIAVWNGSDSTLIGTDSINADNITINDSLYLLNLAGSEFGTSWLSPTISGAIDTGKTVNAGWALSQKQIPTIYQLLSDTKNGEIAWWCIDSETKTLTKHYGISSMKIWEQPQALMGQIELSLIYIKILTTKVNILYLLIGLLFVSLVCQQKQIYRLKNK